MRSMATQTDVNNHKNQRHSLHYPLGSPGSYADEKVRVFISIYKAIGNLHLPSNYVYIYQFFHKWSYFRCKWYLKQFKLMGSIMETPIPLTLAVQIIFK